MLRPACQEAGGDRAFCAWRVCTMFYGGYRDDIRLAIFDSRVIVEIDDLFGRLTAMPGNNMMEGMMKGREVWCLERRTRDCKKKKKKKKRNIGKRKKIEKTKLNE